MMFVITVTCIEENGPTDWEDRNFQPHGAYVIKDRDMEQALEIFHRNIPISCLEDFRIEPWEIKQELESDSHPTFFDITIP